MSDSTRRRRRVPVDPSLLAEIEDTMVDPNAPGLAGLPLGDNPNPSGIEEVPPVGNQNPDGGDVQAVPGFSGMPSAGNQNPNGIEVPEMSASLSAPKKRGPKPKVKITNCGSANSHTVTDADFSDTSTGSSVYSIPGRYSNPRQDMNTPVPNNVPNAFAPGYPNPNGVRCGSVEPPIPPQGAEPTNFRSVHMRQGLAASDAFPGPNPNQYPQGNVHPEGHYPPGHGEPPLAPQAPGNFRNNGRYQREVPNSPPAMAANMGHTFQAAGPQRHAPQTSHPVRQLIRSDEDGGGHASRGKTMTSAELFNSMQRWPVKFSGLPHEDVELFLSHVEDARKFLPVADETFVEGITFLLSGKAYLWYKARVQAFKTWEQVREAFRCTYSDPDFQIAIREELAVRNQGEDESVNAFFTCIRGYYTRIVPVVSEVDQVVCTHRKLIPPLQAGVTLTSTMTMDELEKAAKRLEKIFEKANDWRPPPTPAHSVCPSLGYQSAKTSSRPFYHRQTGPPRSFQAKVVKWALIVEMTPFMSIRPRNTVLGLA